MGRSGVFLPPTVLPCWATSVSIGCDMFDMLPNDPASLAILLLSVFLVAIAYSSVGHGGASGYLAVLSFFGLAPAAMAPGALMLNLLVAGTAFTAYHRKDYFVWRLVWPFLITSVPLAFLGGMLSVPPGVYMSVLAAALTFAAVRLLLAGPSKADEYLVEPPPLVVALPVGAVLGFVSGLIGVGGGIFLSPLLILLHWADAKRTAAASAAFIWINSAAGLYGHLSRQAVDWHGLLWLVGAASAGGMIGSWLGAARVPGVWLRRVLGVVLLVATVKLVRFVLAGG